MIYNRLLARSNRRRLNGRHPADWSQRWPAHDLLIRSDNVTATLGFGYKLAASSTRDTVALFRGRLSALEKAEMPGRQ